MTSSQKATNPGINENIITPIHADLRWLRKERNKTILILAIAGIIVFVLSIIYQDIYYAIVRGFIFSIACFIFYFKSDSIIGYHIQFQLDGKIIIKKGFLKRVISFTDLGNIHLVKKGKYWLIGEKRIRVLIAAFPDLDKKIKAIKS
jgi:hypothetical protein